MCVRRKTVIVNRVQVSVPCNRKPNDTVINKFGHIKNGIYYMTQ